MLPYMLTITLYRSLCWRKWDFDTREKLAYSDRSGLDFITPVTSQGDNITLSGICQQGQILFRSQNLLLSRKAENVHQNCS